MKPPIHVSQSELLRVPSRSSRNPIIVLKFGGTTVGATPEQGRIKLAQQLITTYLDQGNFVVPVFSAYRRGRSGSSEKVSVTDRLQGYADIVLGEDDFDEGVKKFRRQIAEPHEQMLRDLKLTEDGELCRELSAELDHLRDTAALALRSYESSPSLDAYLVTAGERLSTRILAAYFNRLHREGKIRWRAARVTALELGLYTDADFLNAQIDWGRAVEHAREVLLGKYLEEEIIPVVTGFDGIYDPEEVFRGVMRDDRLQHPDRRFTGAYRTALGRGGSDLTATFLGLALGAEFVGFAKETPGVLTGDDMLVGDSARTIPALDYDLATEAGNLYAKAVEPLRLGNIPVHIFDPRTPEQFTAIGPTPLSEGLFLIAHPRQAVNIRVSAVPTEPGSLMGLLQHLATTGLEVDEVRHQRSGTDFIVEGEEKDIERAVEALDTAGFQPQVTFIWYIRVIGNITPQLTMAFNRFVEQFHPHSSASYQEGTRVLTASFHRNRVGTVARESDRIRGIVKQIHDELVLSHLGSVASTPAPAEAVGAG